MKPRHLLTTLFALVIFHGSFFVLDAQTNEARGGRFSRGGGGRISYTSFVIPLSYQKGVAYDLISGNATNFYPNNPWTNYYYHWNGTNNGVQNWLPSNQTAFLTNRIAYKNPIAAFGSRVGGTPLYIGNDYSFTAYAGDPYPWPQYFADAIQIWVYWRTNFAYAGAINVPIPLIVDTNSVTKFATNGFTFSTNAFGLTTVISDTSQPDWNVESAKFTYVLKHSAEDTATNYIYEVVYSGYADSPEGTNALVVDADGYAQWSDLYTMEFEKRNPLRSQFIDQPHFTGQPLPPEYQGKSLQELTNVAATMPDLSALTPANYLAFDHSPELRQHPILDQFVTDMRNDPLALANYVLNEIELSDPIDFDTNLNRQPTINPGGVNRSALAVFQEGRGSPAEQCALLVYLLRKAGVPATYVFPPNNGLKMLDTQLSKLLRFQLKGAMNWASEPFPTWNLAYGKTATQSSTYSAAGAGTAVASLALDGNMSGLWLQDYSVSSTSNNATAWWHVDLGSTNAIGNIEIWNRTDAAPGRLANFYVFVSDNPFTVTNLASTLTQTGVSNYFVANLTNDHVTIPVNRGGRYVRVQLSQTNFLSLAEVRVLPPATPLVGVNYPWVSAYVGTNWVHVFPWMKDTEIVEGLDLYDYMPTNYNTGYKWMMKYLAADTNIMSLSQSDQVADLFPKFIQKGLNENFPGLSTDDLGVHINNRRNLYASWDKFPKPFSLVGIPTVYEKLSLISNIFDTIEIRAYSVTNTSKFIDTGELKLAEIHNRKIQLRFNQVGANNVHDMVLSLAAYSPTITSITNFSTTNTTWKLMQTNQWNSTDNTVRIKVTHRKSKFLGNTFATDPNFNAWGYTYSEEGYINATNGFKLEQEFDYRKGDLVTFNLNLGKVSEKMLNVHAEEIWNFERNADTNNPATLDPDIYQGTTTYLMGLSYFYNDTRFNERLAHLHKMVTFGDFQYGFAVLEPKRTSTGALTNNGNVILVKPTLNIPNIGFGIVFNGTLRPDSGRDFFSAFWDFNLIRGTHGSCGEHGIINSFFHTNAFSTVRLLHLASTNQVEIDQGNWQAKGELVYFGKKLRLHDPEIWTQISSYMTNTTTLNKYFRQGIVTPGMITNGSYSGMGALLMGNESFSSLITGGLHGGEALPFPPATFTAANAENMHVGVNPADSLSRFYFDGIAQTIAAGGTPSWQIESTLAGILGNQIYADPTLGTASYIANLLYGAPSANIGNGYLNLYNGGVVGTFPSNPLDPISYASDPVNTMTGEFYIDATDLKLPGPMPLVVRRNYSSLNLAENEFGFGWRMSYMPFLTVCTNGLIYAAEPEGSVLVYEKTATNANVFLPNVARNPHLNNNSSAGLGSTANRFNGRIDLANVSGTNTYTMTIPDGSIRTFLERSFSIGASFARTRPYLSRWQDNRGNFYTFDYGTDSTKPDFGEMRRIQSSNGGFLGFYYDVNGHVIEAYAGDGRRLFYEYDAYGDLVKTTLPDESEITYEYQHSTFVTNSVTNIYSTHLLTSENKPDGRILQNQYDLQRRVTNQLSTVGLDLTPLRNATFVYSNNFVFTNSVTNGVSGYTLVSDILNRTNRYDYTNSLITKITDPLSQTVEQFWYATNATPPGYPRGLWKTKDKRGLISEFQYDQVGNVTNTIASGDLLGDGTTVSATNSVTYNTNNLPLEATDPVGNKTKTTYSATFPFKAEQIVRSAGVTPISTNFMTYYNVTNTFVSGGVTYTNLANGLLQRMVRAYNSSDAATNEWSHDGRGFVTNQTQYTGTTDATVVSAYAYNDRGELVEQTDAAGRKKRFDYDGIGRPKYMEVYEAAQTTPLSWEYSYYNDNGELTWSDGPRFDPEDYIWRDYDGAGRKTQEIHWRSRAKTDGSGVEAETGDALYATTFLQYDGYGHLIKSIGPRGTIVTNTWDGADRLIQRKVLDTNGITVLTTEGFSYEPGGLIQFQTNALGGVSQTLYTITGQPRFQSNANGSTNGWLYYIDGRQRREIQNNGSYWETTYDDANRRTTKIFYSAASVALATNIAETDRRGNLIRSVDAGGNAFTNIVDGLDRLKLSVGPLISFDLPPGVPLPGPGPSPVQQRTTNVYDAAGVVMTKVNAIGEKSITYHDALGRITRTEVRSANNTLVRETTSVFSANHHSVTVTNGSGATAIVSTGYSDTEGNSVLGIAYPTAGVQEFTRSHFDVGGNLDFETRASVSSGVLTTWTTASYAYDALNRVRTKTDRDNAVTTFDYDASGNVTNRVMPGGLKWKATYNNANQVLSDYDQSSGGSVTRSNSYAYYASGNSFAGLLQTRTDGRGGSCTHTYDIFLRPVTNAYTGTLDEQKMTNSWQYDVRGLVKTFTENFASAATGPATVVSRFYDAYGQMSGESVSIGGASVSVATFSRDSAGRRIGLGFGSFGYSHGWRADGLLTSATGPTGGGTYTYDTAGKLLTRALGPRSTTINQRDGMGRPLWVVTLINMVTNLNETITWTGDGLLATHGIVRADYTDSRTFSYATSSRRLSQEILKLDASTFWTNSFAYDNGVAAGAGVLTRAGQPAVNGIAWKGGADSFSRINTETNSVARRPAYGKVNGLATVTATQDGKSIPVTVIGTNALQWRTMLDMTPGAHQLIATAKHPSGQYTTNANVWYTNNAADRVEASFTGDGQLSQRIWKKADGTTNRIQTLSWDAKGRLYKAVERDSNQSGQDFTVVYDSLNRRLRTTQIVVTNGVALTNLPIVITHYFDPSVEFLELGVSEPGKPTTWKLMGPDFDGVYGGQNGTGGFDAMVPGPELFCPTVQDINGNLHGVYDVGHASFSWNPSRVTGYGAVPGYRPLTLGSTGNLVAKSAWRNRAMESIGYVWGGKNWYDPESGQFISFDPAGHDGSPSGYSFCMGNPWGWWDPDFRLGVNEDVHWGEWAKNTALSLLSNENMGPATSDPVIVRDYYDQMRIKAAQQEWFNNLSPEEQTASRVPLPLVFTGTKLAGDIGRGDFDASMDSLGHFSGDLLVTAITFGMGRSMSETPVTARNTTTTTVVESGPPMGFASNQAYREEWSRMVVQERAGVIQPQLGRSAGFGETYGVGVTEGAEGNLQVIISSKSRYGIKDVNDGLLPGEQYINYGVKVKSHAEIQIQEWAQGNNSQLRSVGATRPVCVSCQDTLDTANIPIATPRKNP